MNEFTVSNGDSRLRLYRGGGGTASVLFLHGLTFDASTFSSLVSHLPLEIEWWTADFRGHGHSSWTGLPYLYSDLMDDTMAIIRDGIEKPVYLFGHSLGGAVALAVAALAPEWVRGLIVSDNFLTRKSYAAALQLPLVRTLFEGLSNLASRKLDTGSTAQALADMELPGPDGQPIPLGQFPGNTPEFLAMWANALTLCDPEAALMTLDEANCRAFEGEAYLQRLQCPLLLLQADPALGGMLPDEDINLAEGIRPDLKVQQFPGAGHFMHLHESKATANAVTAFVRR